MHEEGPKRIGELFKFPERLKSASSTSKTGPNSERAELIGKFTDRLNESRKGSQFKPLTYPAIAFKLSHLSVSDLYFLWSTCDKADNFSKIFWWSIKVKK